MNIRYILMVGTTLSIFFTLAAKDFLMPAAYGTDVIAPQQSSETLTQMESTPGNIPSEDKSRIEGGNVRLDGADQTDLAPYSDEGQDAQERAILKAYF